MLTAFPELEARGGDLFDQFEAVDLAALRQQAKVCTAGGVTARQALFVGLAGALQQEAKCAHSRCRGSATIESL